MHGNTVGAGRETPLSPVQWSAILGSIVVLVWSVPGLIVNPDFSTGAAATSERVLGVDMNGWHAVSGFVIAVPGFFAARRRTWSTFFVLQAGFALAGAGVWALFSTRPLGGLFYFPGNVSDAVLHFGVSSIYFAGGIHHFMLSRRSQRA